MNHPVVGGRGYDSPDLHESLTLLPRVLLGSRVRLPGDTSIALLAGTTQTVSGFWIAANLAGLCMGSSQAAGRAIVGYLAPPARLAEFFGLWGLAVKTASIFGPLTYGAVTWLFAGNHRLAIFATGLYFVVGLALLWGIDVERGRRHALAA